MEAVAKKSTSAKATADKPAVKKASAAKRARKPAVHKPKAVKEQPKLESAETAPVAEVKPKTVHHGKHFYAVGRRKTSVSQVVLSAGNGVITVNLLPLEGYFQSSDLQYIVHQPLVAVGQEKNLNIKAKVHGGGIHSQAEATRHAIARAIILMDPESRRTVKKLGFLRRDPRVKERKKPGLKRARRAPQFSKR